MAFWGKVWRTNVSPTMAGCYNITSPDQIASTTPTILQDIPVGITSVSDAVGYWLDCLRRRLACTMTATNSGETIYNVTIRRGARVDTMVWTLSNTQGKYPIGITYATPNDSGSGSFYNMHQALDWSVQRLA